MFVTLLLIVIFLLTRITLLVHYPIFNDEAIHLRFGQIIWNTGYWQYPMMHSGKQSLPYIVYGVYMNFIRDPLLAGRSVSVLIGLFTLIATYLLSKKLFKTSNRIFLILYIICPIILFFDTLAVVDVMLSFLYVFELLILYVMITGSGHFLKNTIMLGILCGIGLWIKSTGIILLVSISVIYFILIKPNSIRAKLTGLFLIIFVSIITAIPYVMQPEFSRVTSLLSDHSYSITDSIKYIDTIPNKITQILLVIIGYVSPFSIVAICLISNKWNDIRYRFLFLAFVIPLLIMLPTAKVFHSRYIIFLIPVLLVILGDFFNMIGRSFIVYGSLTLMGLLSAVLIIQPPKFFHLYPSISVWGIEQSQYIDSFASGYGVKEAINFVITKAHALPNIFVRWDSGNPEDTVLLYQKNIGYQSGYLDSRITKKNIQIDNRENNVFFITRANQLPNYPVEVMLLQSFHKPYGDETVDVYEIMGMKNVDN